jgi:hypothetical protein
VAKLENWVSCGLIVIEYDMSKKIVIKENLREKL